MNKYLDFESDIEILDSKISELHINDRNFINEKNKLTEKKNTILKKKYSNLSAWEKVQVARHADRPHSIDYIKLIFDEIIFYRSSSNVGDGGLETVDIEKTYLNTKKIYQDSVKNILNDVKITYKPKR